MSGGQKRSISDFFSNTIEKQRKVSGSGRSVIELEHDTVESEVSMISEHNGESFPLDISISVSDGPQQPVLNKYPQRQFGQEKRCFQAAWFKTYPWLEYSVVKDAVFCFPCRFFATAESGRYSSFTAIEGYTNWKKALSTDAGIRKHEYSDTHKKSCASLEAFRRMTDKDPQSSIATMISDAYSAEVRENRDYVGQIADVLRFTAVQGIAQRGHDESQDSENRGNFLELLELISKHNSIVAKKIKGPQNARYVHPSIQNEILDILANATLEVVKKMCIKQFILLLWSTKAKTLVRLSNCPLLFVIT